MLKFGWSKRTISMNGPVLIIGQAHERVSKGILDENLVTALVIEDGTTVSAIVSADLIGASDGIILEIRDAMKKKCPSFPAQNIMLSVTHTHTSPRYHRTTGYDHAPHDRIEFIDPEVVREFIIEQTTDAIAEAYFNRDVGSTRLSAITAAPPTRTISVFVPATMSPPPSASTSTPKCTATQTIPCLWAMRAR